MKVVVSKNCNKQLSEKKKKRIMVALADATFSKPPKKHIEAISAKELTDVKK